MTVADNLAGKKGKCKCGNAVLVPAPKQTAAAATAAAASPGMAAVFDDLTESDFARQSPYEKIYSPVNTNNDQATLQRYQAKEIEEKQKKAGAAGGMLVFIALLNIIAGVGCAGLAVVFMAAQDVVAKIKDVSPELSMGTGVAIAFFSVAAIVLIGGAVGLFMRKKWGWFLTAMCLAFIAVMRTGVMVLVLKEGFNQAAFFSTGIPVLGSLALCGFIFNGDTQELFGIKKMTASIVAGVVGIAGAGGMLGMLFSMLNSGG